VSASMVTIEGHEASGSPSASEGSAGALAFFFAPMMGNILLVDDCKRAHKYYSSVSDEHEADGSI
jgi:hypothetical protein